MRQASKMLEVDDMAFVDTDEVSVELSANLSSLPGFRVAPDGVLLCFSNGMLVIILP
jgi:hypothetical protein